MVLHVMKKMKKNNSGLSLLEALISMVVVGIGFVAILQVTQYSISSVNTSAERTKANFFINIFAEDSLSLRDTSKSENLNDILVVEDSTRFSSECGVQGSKMNVKTGTAGDVYRNSTSDNDPVLNKSEKWNALISNRDYMDCSNSGREKRAFEMFKICNFSSSPGCIDRANQKEEVIYIGRAQMTLNNGGKRKYLYFQSDFRLKP